MQFSSDSIQTRLEATRKDLLDLGLTNLLLNYRPNKNRGVEIVNELPREIFRILIREKKAMVFTPDTSLDKLRPGVDQPSDLESSPLFSAWPLPYAESGGDGVLDKRFTDLKMQTHYSTLNLQSRLLRTYNDARTSIQEQGVNILYLALGMLEWYEVESVQQPRRAPLVLVPVELVRTDVRERFQLRWTEEDIGDNLSLEAKLKAEYRINLPTLPEIEDLDLENYFSKVAQALISQPRWRVDNSAIVLGFFSFGKFLLYKDLEPAAWPLESQPANHPLMQALFTNGFIDPPGLLPEGENLDRHLSPTALKTIVDADSSQTLAILDVDKGRNLVIHGPPGTGKSQTIANLIAQAIGSGKTVLFVSEKMDALEVVKRRLDKAGLGQACLELHSHKANKKTVLVDLFRTLQLSQPRQNQLAEELKLLTATRERLNAYCEAVSYPIGESTITPYLILGELLEKSRNTSSSMPAIKIKNMESWSRAEYNRKAALVEELAVFLTRIGLPPQHLFYGSRKTMLLPSEEGQLVKAIREALQALDQLQGIAAFLIAPLKVPEPQKPWESEELLKQTKRVAESPELKGLNLKAGEWLIQATQLKELLASGAAWQELHQQYERVFVPAAWSQDFTSLRQILVEQAGNFLRVLSGKYKEAQQYLASICLIPLPKKVEEQLALVDIIIRTQTLEAAFNRGQGLGIYLFGPRWLGIFSDFKILGQMAEWVGTLHQDVRGGRCPQSIIDFLETFPDLSGYRRATTDFQLAISAQAESFNKVTTLLELDFKSDLNYKIQRETLEGWQNRSGEWKDIVLLNTLAQRCREEGIEEVFRAGENTTEAGKMLLPAFRKGWLETLLDQAFKERAALAQFNRAVHEQTILKFQELDELTFAYNRTQLALAHWRKLPSANPETTFSKTQEQLDILRQEFGKKTRLMPLRKLMKVAAATIQAIKPVFMMSPLSIATYIPPGSLMFDLVVFDEASQVKPADAFGAILRGKQVVVAGDDRQLPPTSFFDSITQPQNNGDEDEEGPVITTTGDFESILTLFKAKSMARMLRWHYRSRHESLIAVSNAEFYENKLIIFPSPDSGKLDTGLVYHYLPDTIYDRGKSRTNRLEALAIAKAVLEHAKKSPTLTLGVAALSVAQRDAIMDQLEVLRQQDPGYENFFNSHPDEPFFVKSLEHVQGDERDVIFISIGYGRDAEGKLTMGFGPINGTGGERRLNVLISRARRRCEVFTNLTVDDINLNDEQAKERRGLKVLKTFLEYAKTGRLSIASPTEREQDSPFEQAVLIALTDKGYQVVPQVGQAGYFIDLAVVDPEKPGRYLLGIECDGANYHSALSARDRDRLRQKVLEGLGWQIHRIWSTDWFQNPGRELERTVAVIEEARRDTNLVENTPVPANSPNPISAPHQLPELVVIPYQIVELSNNGLVPEASEVPVFMMADWALKVIQVESPVHVKEVSRRIGTLLQQNRINKYVEPGINYLIEKELVRKEGDFLWTPSMSQPPLRIRTGLPAASRKLEMVCGDECLLAIYKVIAVTGNIEAEKLPLAVCKLLGLGQVSAEIHQTIMEHTEQLVQLSRVKRQGELLMIVA